MYTYNGGWIEVITGPKFSGKTEELIRRITRAGIANQKVGVFKPKKDKDDEESVIKTHSGEEVDGYLIDNLHVLYQLGQNYDVVALDKVEYITPSQIIEDRAGECPMELYDILNKLADMGRRVIVAGLDMDARGNPVEQIIKLMAVAEKVDKLTAICQQCGAIATRTQKIVDGRSTTSNEPLVEDNSKSMYEPRCRECHKI